MELSGHKKRRTFDCYKIASNEDLAAAATERLQGHLTAQPKAAKGFLVGGDS
jgi:hypothetical protein